MNETERYEEVCKPALELISEEIKHVRKLLEGNGKEGLVQIQIRHDERIGSICKGIAWLWGIVGSCITAVAAYVITHFIKISA